MDALLAILSCIAVVGLCLIVCYSMFMFFTVPSLFAIIMAYGCGGPIVGTIITIPVLVFWCSGVSVIYSEWKFDRLYKKSNNH